MTYKNRLDEIEDTFDDAQMRLVRDAERAMVNDHHGGVVHVPTVVVKKSTHDTVFDLERNGLDDYGDAKRFVIARSFDNALSSNWNPHYQPDE